MSSAVGQLNEDDLKSMTSEQIAAAYEAGRLNALLGRKVPGSGSARQLNVPNFKGMSAEDIVAATNRGELDDYLGRVESGPPTPPWAASTP
jgi:hypothetical protein